jgi:hypothetical protein
MSFTTQVEITTNTIVTAKIVPLQFLFSGTKLDQGEGKVCITSIGREADGSEHALKASCPQGYVERDLSLVIGGTYAGISGAQVLAALAALADSLYETP